MNEKYHRVIQESVVNMIIINIIRYQIIFVKYSERLSNIAFELLNCEIVYLTLELSLYI